MRPLVEIFRAPDGCWQALSFWNERMRIVSISFGYTAAEALRNVWRNRQWILLDDPMLPPLRRRL